MADRSALTSIILEKKLANKLTGQNIAAEIAPGASSLFIPVARGDARVRHSQAQLGFLRCGLLQVLSS
jgi:hypothetical protein